MGFDSLAHFQELNGGLRQWHDALRKDDTDHGVGIPCEVFNIGKDVFGEE